MPQTTDAQDAVDTPDATDGDKPLKRGHLQTGATSTLKEQAITTTSTTKTTSTPRTTADSGKQVAKGGIVHMKASNGKAVGVVGEVTVDVEQAAANRDRNTSTDIDIDRNEAGDTINAAAAASTSAQGDVAQNKNKKGDGNELDDDDFEFDEFDDDDCGDIWGWYSDLYDFVDVFDENYSDWDNFESDYEYDDDDDDDIADDFFE